MFGTLDFVQSPIVVEIMLINLNYFVCVASAIERLDIDKLDLSDFWVRESALRLTLSNVYSLKCACIS